MKYMLDTNICIALIRQKPQSVIQHVVACTPGDIALSSITVAELAHGAYKSNQTQKNLQALEQLTLPLEVVDFDQRASIAYGQIRAMLEEQGNIIGSMDLLIGAHALSLGLILITNNTREFERIPNLKLEDWLK